MSAADTRPITLRSPIQGLELRLQKGESTLIAAPGTGEARFRDKFGKWATFVRGQCVLMAHTKRPGAPAYLPMYGSREAAIEALKGNPHHGRDFFIVDVVDAVESAPGAGSKAKKV